MTSMAADMSYTVEVKKGVSQFGSGVRASSVRDGGPPGEGQFNVETYSEGEEGYELEDIAFFDTREEAQQYADEINLEHNSRKGAPSRYYERLTVPGGTKYEENDIRTPALVPVTSSHAQFASRDHSIGWFRSDTLAERTCFLN